LGQQLDGGREHCFVDVGRSWPTWHLATSNSSIESERIVSY
jgi:hypothetical protein